MNRNGENSDIKNILFFGFYIIFFIFVGLILRSNLSNNKTTVDKYNSGYNKSFTLKDINKNNYHFNYELTKNGNTIIFDGDKYKNKQEFIKSGDYPEYYYSDDNNYYLRNNSTLKYENIDNPIEFSKFIEISNLEKLFVHSTYTSYTEYFTGKQIDYNYEISTTTLLRNIDKIITDLDDLPNKISVESDDGKIYKINMDLTSYYKYFDDSIYEYKLTLTYTKYGDINEIKDLT